MCEEAKRDFRRNEWFNMAWQASVQHSKTYIDIPDGAKHSPQRKLLEDAKKQLRNNIKKEINIWIFGQPRNLGNYISYVVDLSNKMTQKYGQWLTTNQQGSRRFRIGTSQKLCGLYLKYLWCAGEIKWRPPACPFDALILTNIGLREVNWTTMDKVEQLKDWINGAAQKAAENPQYQKSIAIWELLVFEKSRQTKQ